MTELGVGEAREKARRSHFFKIVLGLTIPAAIAGAFGGILLARSHASGQPIALDPTLAWIGVSIAMAAFIYGCWAYFKAIDEVDLTDNLWGSTASFYIYAILFGGWSALSFLGATNEPNHMAIFWLSLFAGLLVYLYRKWRAR